MIKTGLQIVSLVNRFFFEALYVSIISMLPNQVPTAQFWPLACCIAADNTTTLDCTQDIYLQSAQFK